MGLETLASFVGGLTGARAKQKQQNYENQFTQDQLDEAHRRALAGEDFQNREFTQRGDQFRDTADFRNRVYGEVTKPQFDQNFAHLEELNPLEAAHARLQNAGLQTANEGNDFNLTQNRLQAPFALIRAGQNSGAPRLLTTQMTAGHFPALSPQEAVNATRNLPAERQNLDVKQAAVEAASRFSTQPARRRVLGFFGQDPNSAPTGPTVPEFIAGRNLAADRENRAATLGFEREKLRAVTESQKAERGMRRHLAEMSKTGASQIQIQRGLAAFARQMKTPLAQEDARIDTELRSLIDFNPQIQATALQAGETAYQNEYKRVGTALQSSGDADAIAKAEAAGDAARQRALDTILGGKTQNASRITDLLSRKAKLHRVMSAYDKQGAAAFGANLPSAYDDLDGGTFNLDSIE